jgi:hypothetical protein
MNSCKQWTTWRKSSYSGGTDHGNCVEVAFTVEAVAIRDSKNPDGPHLEFPHPHWKLLAGSRTQKSA